MVSARLAAGPDGIGSIRRVAELVEAGVDPSARLPRARSTAASAASSPWPSRAAPRAGRWGSRTSRGHVEQDVPPAAQRHQRGPPTLRLKQAYRRAYLFAFGRGGVSRCRPAGLAAARVPRDPPRSRLVLNHHVFLAADRAGSKIMSGASGSLVDEVREIRTRGRLILMTSNSAPALNSREPSAAGPLIASVPNRPSPRVVPDAGICAADDHLGVGLRCSHPGWPVVPGCRSRRGSRRRARRCGHVTRYPEYSKRRAERCPASTD
jgi:hypothetical protein